MGLTRLWRLIGRGSGKSKASTAPARVRTGWRPSLEVLEDRATPSAFPVSLYVFPTPVLVHVTVTGPFPGRITPSTSVAVPTAAPVLAPALSLAAISL